MQFNVEYSDIIPLFSMIPRCQGAGIGEKIMENLLQCLDKQYSSDYDYVSCLMDKTVNLPQGKNISQQWMADQLNANTHITNVFSLRYRWIAGI